MGPAGLATKTQTLQQGGRRQHLNGLPLLPLTAVHTTLFDAISFMKKRAFGSGGWGQRGGVRCPVVWEAGGRGLAKPFSDGSTREGPSRGIPHMPTPPSLTHLNLGLRAYNSAAIRRPDGLESRPAGLHAAGLERVLCGKHA